MEVGDYMPKFNDDIIGKKVMQHCGMNATCIAYRGNKDIDIKFEDGTVVYHKTKDCFIQGSISNPNFNPASCIGVTVMQKCGMKATCIAYRKAKDIDI